MRRGRQLGSGGRRRLLLALLGAACTLAGAFHPVPCAAHALSPSLLTLRELGDGIVEVGWKTPLLRLPGADPRPVLPAECRAATPARLSEGPGSVTATWTVDCEGTGLVGRTIAVEGLGAAKTDALVHVELSDGRVIDTVVRAREPRFTLPARSDTFSVSRRYAALGIEHILSGYDHLLFVLGLLMLAASVRQLLATVTSFTLGHSITLSLAALGVARVPAAPVEALIALSIFLLAVELASARPGMLGRRPWLMAAAFGLLHGLGFASALSDAGLPADSVPLALLSFNVGIEAGQIAFVLVLVSLYAAWRVLSLGRPAWARAATIYAIGSLAAYWMIERSVPLF